MTNELLVQKARVFFVENALDLHSTTYKDVIGGCTVRQALVQAKGEGFKEFQYPTIVLLKGEAVMRKDWDAVSVKDNDELLCVRVLGTALLVIGIISLVLALISLGVTLYFVLTQKKMKGRDDPESVYNLSGQKNQTKLNQPIESPYGRCRLWPSYAARPYSRYQSEGRQYYYSLFCLGQGEYDVENLFLEDTPIEHFSGVQYEFYPPGKPVTMFPDKVSTSEEVNNVELLPPDDANYVGWVGPFVIVDSGDVASDLEVDIVFPNGLCKYNDDGGLANITVSFTVQYRQIDDWGNPESTNPTWKDLCSETITKKTPSPYRYSRKLNVPPGRYEIRARRNTHSFSGNNVQDKIFLESAKAYIPLRWDTMYSNDYGNVTLLAVVLIADVQLNDSSKARVNLYATRRLPQFVPQNLPAAGAPLPSELVGYWATVPLMPTRSIVWAFCNAITAPYGGNLPVSVLDLSSIWKAHMYFEAHELYFDGIFDTKDTLWDALKTILLVGRAYPILNTNRIGIALERPAETPVAMFTPQNIVAGSLSIEQSFRADSDFDGIAMEYTDPYSWLQEVRMCKIGGAGQEGLDPEEMKLLGSTNELQAWRLGMWQLMRKKLQNTRFTFSTGLDGLLVQFNDVILLQHDLLKSSTGTDEYRNVAEDTGYVLSADYTGRMELSAPVPAGYNKIQVKGRDGKPFFRHTFSGDYANSDVLATFTIDPNLPNVIYTTNYFMGVDANINLTEPNAERATYILSKENIAGKMLVVQTVTPNDDGTVAIEALNYDPDIYYYDDKEPGDLRPPRPPSKYVDFDEPKNLQLAVIKHRRNGSSDNTDYWFEWWANWQGSSGAVAYDVLFFIELVGAPSDMDRAAGTKAFTTLRNAVADSEANIARLYTGYAPDGKPKPGGNWRKAMAVNRLESYGFVKREYPYGANCPAVRVTDSLVHIGFEQSNQYNTDGENGTNCAGYYGVAVCAVHSSGARSSWAILDDQSKIYIYMNDKGTGTGASNWTPGGFKLDVYPAFVGIQIDALSIYNALVIKWNVSTPWGFFLVRIYDATDADAPRLIHSEDVLIDPHATSCKWDYKNAQFLLDTDGNKDKKVKVLNISVTIMIPFTGEYSEVHMNQYTLPSPNAVV